RLDDARGDDARLARPCRAGALGLVCHASDLRRDRGVGAGTDMRRARARPCNAVTGARRGGMDTCLSRLRARLRAASVPRAPILKTGAANRTRASVLILASRPLSGGAYLRGDGLLLGGFTAGKGDFRSLAVWMQVRRSR